MTHRVLTCPATIGVGGLGQHLAQLVEETSEAGMTYVVYCTGDSEDERVVTIRVRAWDRLLLPKLQRFSAAALNGLVGDLFDTRVARRLTESPEHFMGFVGKSLRSFRRARELGCENIELIAANSHVLQVAERHRLAAEKFGHGDSWLGNAQIRKTMREYEEADRIFVHSVYTRNSFLDRGIPAAKLQRTTLKIPGRFVPDSAPGDDVFRVVYAGRIDLTKGVPLLIDAFKRLDIAKSELRLLGGYPSRAIRDYCERLVDGDPRITIKAGNPVEAFQAADVYVHPSFEDGYAYAPAEALACGTPAIVSADTGMKEYIEEGVNGFIVPTGDVDAVVERLLSIHRQPLKSTQPLLPAEVMAAGTSSAVEERDRSENVSSS